MCHPGGDRDVRVRQAARDRGRAQRAAAGDRLDVTVTGRQFYWQFEYPNGVIAIDRLRAPRGPRRPPARDGADFDVIHSWWIPALGGKIDALPGVVNETWFHAERTGIFQGRCAELCGAQARAHARRGGGAAGRRVRPLARAAPGAQQTAGTSPLGEEQWNGVCAKCHGPDGQGGYGPAIADSSSAPGPAGDRGAAPRRASARCRPWARDWSQRGDGRDDRLPGGALRRWQLESSRPLRWHRGRVASWLVTVDHKRIGILYIATAGVFFAIGGLLAVLIRTQLAQANETLLTNDSYNEVVTIHGTTMVFLVVVPVLAGFGNFLVPLMIGAQDMAFPRLNALSYWLYLFGGLVLILSFFADGGSAQAGWTSYPTLCAAVAGNGQDLWILSLHILTLSSLAGAINFIVTIHNMRDARDDVDAPAAVRLVDGGLRVAARARAADALGGDHDDAARPAGLDALLQPGRRRQRRALPARLLVLRAPRGLHHGAPGDGDHLGDHPGLRAQADLRLQGGRVLDGGDRVLLDARLGPPHVHGGDARPT